MGRVVLDVVNLGQLVHRDGESIGQRSLQILELSKVVDSIAKERLSRTMAEDEGRFPQEVGLWVTADGDGVQLFAFDATDFQAAADGR